jgi:hypothetical protein
MAHYRRLNFSSRALGWRGWVGLVLVVAVALAVIGALILLSLGIAVVLLPIVAVAILIGRWRLRGLVRSGVASPDDRPEKRPSPPVIEGEYRVIEVERPRPRQT